MPELIKRYLYKAPFELEAFSLDFPPGVEPGQNRAPFQGVLTRLNEPSTRPPNGSDGHRVQIPSLVAQGALQSLVGMPINCSLTMRDHDKKFVVGSIDRGEIIGNDLIVYGTLFDKNFPDEVQEIRRIKDRLGMSYEISGVEVEDATAPTWVLTKLVFTGAAILEKNAAAYAKTAIAAQAEEEWPMPAVEDVLKKIEAIGDKIDAMALQADSDEDDEEARRHEEDAKRHDDEAKRHDEDAARARSESDEEDAKRHDDEAKSKRNEAAKRRADAMKKHEEAAKKRREAGDEEAAKRHDDEAKRLKDEDAKRHDDEARRRDDEDAARKASDDDDDDEMNAITTMLSMYMRAMGRRKVEGGKAIGTPSGNMGNGHHVNMLKELMNAMTYPATYAKGKRKQDAAHDDTAEDTALFRKLMKQHDDGTMDAAADRERQLRRRLRTLEASIDLLTDQVGKLSGLLTDRVASQRDLATNVSRQHNGGPARKTMSASGEAWIAKQAQQRQGDAQVMSLEAQETALKGLDASSRIARKIEWEQQGIALAAQ